MFYDKMTNQVTTNNLNFPSVFGQIKLKYQTLRRVPKSSAMTYDLCIVQLIMFQIKIEYNQTYRLICNCVHIGIRIGFILMCL